MAGEWQTARIEDIADKVAMGPFGSTIKVETFVPEGVPVISGAHLHGTRLKDGDFNFVTPAHADKLKNANVFRGDVIFTHAGNIGQVAYIPENSCFERYVISQRQFYLRCNRSKAQPEFVTYYFKSHEGQHKLLANASQVGVPSIARPSSYLKTIEIPLPSLSEQRAIAHILGTLDDKIELNRRMSETLEATARAIFKSWFVDFDPVRAKASGEPPESICRRLGLTPDLLALFPDRLVVSELGEIPEGWGVESLEQLTCYLNRGLSPKYVEEGGVLVLNQKCVRGGHVDTSKGRRHDPTQRKVEGRTLEVGDILVNSTGVGTLGRVAQVLAIDEPTIVDSHITVVRSAPEKVSWNYLGITLLERQSEIEALGEGSTGQTELSRIRLGALRVLLPPKPLRDYFDACVTGLRQRGMTNNAQSVTLALIRDALLPKLLSGELRVPVAGAA